MTFAGSFLTALGWGSGDVRLNPGAEGARKFLSNLSGKRTDSFLFRMLHKWTSVFVIWKRYSSIIGGFKS